MLWLTLVWLATHQFYPSSDEHMFVHVWETKLILHMYIYTYTYNINRINIFADRPCVYIFSCIRRANFCLLARYENRCFSTWFFYLDARGRYFHRDRSIRETIKLLRASVERKAGELRGVIMKWEEREGRWTTDEEIIQTVELRCKKFIKYLSRYLSIKSIER